MFDTGSAGFRRREDVRLGDHVGDLVAAPRVALDADAVGVDEALFDQRQHPGHDGVERALSGIPDLVGDVGDEHDVAAARVEGEADRGPIRHRRLVTVQPVGHALVEVDHERDTAVTGSKPSGLMRIPSSGVRSFDIQCTSSALPQRYSACCGFASLSLRGVPEVGVADPHIGELDERLARPHVAVRVLGLRRRPVAYVAHDQFLDPTRLVRPAAGVAGGLGSHVEHGEEDLPLLDPLAPPAAASEAEEVAASALGHALDAIPEVGPPSVGEPQRGLLAARVQSPHVVPVGHDQRGVSLDPNRRAVRRRTLRVVVEFVEERDRQMTGQAPGGRTPVQPAPPSSRGPPRPTRRRTCHRARGWRRRSHGPAPRPSAAPRSPRRRRTHPRTGRPTRSPGGAACRSWPGRNRSCRSRSAPPRERSPSRAARRRRGLRARRPDRTGSRSRFACTSCIGCR